MTTTKIKPVKVLKINLYSFDQLSEDAKKNAISKWYDIEDYPFLADDLTENLHELLQSEGVESNGLQLLYSLSYSQGDGLCFTGEISKSGNTLKLSHRSHYYYATSVSFDYTDSEGEDIEEVEELREIYLRVCNKLEKIGYNCIEYRMNNEEFTDLCEANNYTFTIDGLMNNG